jgi:hypothetical protein
MSGARPILLTLLAAALAACGGGSGRKEIEGNNTGGIIPFEMIGNRDPQSLATAHCAKWGGIARVTFTQRDTGSDVVFVCETPAATPPPPPPATKQGAPAPRPR